MKDFKLSDFLVIKSLRYGLLLFFLVPYIIFFKYFQPHFELDISEFFWAFKNSLMQSGLTAILVTALSVPLSFGLFVLSEGFYKWVSRILLIPQILPALFSILIAFSLIKPFPMGTLGIVLIFTLIHLGYSVVRIHLATQEKLGPVGFIADVYGLSSWDFFIKIYFPLMRAELLMNLVMIFTFCFSSFSIPLIVGGGLGTNLEVLIYEKIFISQNWSAAWILNLLQAIFVVFLSFIFIRKSSLAKSGFIKSRYLISKFGLLCLFIYLVIYLGGYMVGLSQSLSALSSLLSFSTEIMQATLHSLQMLVWYLLLSFILLMFWIFDFMKNYQQNPARHLVSASTILVSFAFYLFFPQDKSFDLLKIIFAMSILFFPTLFKSFLEKPLEQLRSQIFVAEVYGISSLVVIFQIVLRQIFQPFLIWLSFLTVWFLSDFAIQKSLGTQTSTVGLLSENFLTSYRLSQAYLMSFYILILWFVILSLLYFIFEVIHVAYKKFIFKA